MDRRYNVSMQGARMQGGDHDETQLLDDSETMLDEMKLLRPVGRDSVTTQQGAKAGGWIRSIASTCNPNLTI